MAYPLNERAAELCSHGGDAKPIPSTGNPRVRVAGAPVLTVMSPLVIAGCPNNPTGLSPLPCVLGMFASGATRVKVMGMPVPLDSSAPTNLPTGASATTTQRQTRMKGL
jgi:hypothetical protein